MNRRLRVLSIVNDLVHGGDEHRLLSYARHVDRREIDHHVVVIKEPDSEVDERYGSLRGEYAAAGIPLIELGIERYHSGDGRDVRKALARKTRALAQTVRRSVELVRRLEVDVIDGHIGAANVVAVAAGRMTGRPATVTTFHAEDFKPQWLYHRVQRATLRAARTIVTDSHDRADAIRIFLGQRAAPIVVIPNGVMRGTPQREADDVAGLLGLPPAADRIVIGQIGALVTSKGWFVLLDAVAEVFREVPNAYLVCIGYLRDELDFEHRLRARAEQLGIGDRIRIASYPGPIVDVWQVLDIHAHASLFDSLPNAIIEGMAYAKPAVVTAAGDVPKHVIDGVSGIVVPPNDPRSFARGLLSLIRQPQLRAQYSAAARGRYEAGYTAELMTQRLSELFARLASRYQRLSA